MKLLRTALSGAAATLLFAGPVWAQSADNIVQTQSGPVEGHVVDGVQRFFGIPYAAPPVGELRWRAPQPVEPWTEVLEADAFGHECMQRRLATALAPILTDPSEDCLFINIWRPAEATEPLPVMVYFYGGGLTRGGSSSTVYGGDEFAKQGVMMVSFNYRVGRFGFFAHPALSAENDEPKGNYGFMDQVFALGWVQRNIEAFGGDPDQVTIVGESAGARSVHAMVTSPVAEGLFHGAIIQSGSIDRSGGNVQRHISEDQPDLPSLETIGVNFAASRGIEGEGAEALAAMRALTAEEIVDLDDGPNGEELYGGGFVVDGELVVRPFGETYAAGEQAQVPILIGANTDDNGQMNVETMDEALERFGDQKSAALAAYDPQGTGDAKLVGRQVGSDGNQVEPARWVAQTLAEQDIPSYLYRFGYITEGLEGRWVVGAPHAADLAYTFGVVAPYYGPAVSERDREVARIANTYWANFVKNGDPNGADLPEWSAYDPSVGELMIFELDGTAGMAADPWKQRLDLHSAVADGK